MKKRPRLHVLATPVSTGWHRLHPLQSLMLQLRLAIAIKLFRYIFKSSLGSVRPLIVACFFKDRHGDGFREVLQQHFWSLWWSWWKRGSEWAFDVVESVSGCSSIILIATESLLLYYRWEVKFFRTICPRGAQSAKTALWQGLRRSELSWKPWLSTGRVETCSRLAAGVAFQKLNDNIV